MIQFNNISFSYNKNPIFNNLTWKVEKSKEEGLIHFILSPSGYGKSTLFKLILGLLTPKKGSVKTPKNTRISYVPQEPILFEHLSIYDNATFFKNIKARKKEFDEDRFKEFAKVLGFESELLHSKKNINQLSGGQKRKLSLLKALSLNPDILLLDEPTTGLDAQVKLEFLNLLKEIAEKHSILVLYITHHFEEASVIANKIHYLLKEINGIIENIISLDIEEFKDYPPCIEAAYMVDFPKYNITKGEYNEGVFTINDVGNYFKRSIDENKVSIYNKNGRLIL